ncbi:uncharacterized protein DSM5745_09868 [Aspergillus mulundensis]|uniref:Uncharacterized protein n=1 Tax=Aspergillus mulundensis TaxID=1810919 RepID=A0A3D8QRP8_9EURO|nr:hypothetical protein DSM5745_09868 [Aspergillus mulundensis]RDW64457.1 hypothetical protein DSM5745_09868 [Aspergillus mulundensis]
MRFGLYFVSATRNQSPITYGRPASPFCSPRSTAFTLPFGTCNTIPPFEKQRWILKDPAAAAERIWTTGALLSDLGLTPTYAHYPFQHEQSQLAHDPEGQESSRGAWTFPEETPPPFFALFDLPPSSNPPRVWAPPRPPTKTKGTETWQLTAERRTSVPRQCMLVSQASSALSRGRRLVSPALVDFRPWRRLGMPIFDSWRMHLLRLFDFPRNPGDVVPTPDNGFLEVVPRDPEAQARVPLADYTGRLLALVGAQREDDYKYGVFGSVRREVVP